uniref:DUF4283 domain-containing protein n=1 Tax=Cannabis sativa TaxID=3483 RepID=A0A803P5S5_CANSA
MVKTRGRGRGKGNSTKLVKKKGPNSVSDVRKTKSMDAVLGVAPIEFSDAEDEDSIDGSIGIPPGLLEPEALSPKSSLRSIMQQEDIRKDFAHFMEASEQCSAKLSQGMATNPPILRSVIVVRNLFSNSGCNKVKITNDDIQEEVDFWKPSIVCYVLGANPPLAVFEGFVRRMWTDKVERVGLLSYGIYIIRFYSVESRDDVLRGDDLELKYWGERSLFKIIGQIGKPVMVDEATKNREKLSFPRVLIEVSIKQDLPEMIEFEDENGCNTSVTISYEWKPVICAHYEGLGHLTAECRRKEPKKQQQWGWKSKPEKEPTATTTSNKFLALGENNGDEIGRKNRQQSKDKNSSEFRDCVEECNLEDVKFFGNFFTWSNKQLGDERIYSKIDRVLANPSWLDSHPNAEVVFLNEGLLDHSPAVLTISVLLLGGKKPFWYFKMWASHPEYNKLVRDRWLERDKGTKMFQIVTKLKGLKLLFKLLNKQRFAKLPIAHAKAKEELEECQKELHQNPMNIDLQSREVAVRKEFASIQNAYASFLQQKAKILWLKDGDSNAAFYHNSIRNQILGSKMPKRRSVMKRIIEQGPILSNQQADMLVMQYTKEEVKKAIFDIPGNKAPGPDGFSSSFFQDNWDLVGEHVYESITSFLHSG